MTPSSSQAGGVNADTFAAKDTLKVASTTGVPAPSAWDSNVVPGVAGEGAPGTTLHAKTAVTQGVSSGVARPNRCSVGDSGDSTSQHETPAILAEGEGLANHLNRRWLHP